MTMVVLGRDPGRRRCGSSSRSPRASCRPRTRASIFGFTEGAQGIGFEAMVEHQQAVAAIVVQHPDVAAVHVELRPARQHQRRQPGDRLRAAEAAVAAQALGRRDHPGAAAEAREGPGDPRLPPDPAADPAGRQPHQEPVPVHAAGLGHGRALPVRAAAREKLRDHAGPPGRDERPAAREPAGQRRDRPRQGRRRSASRRKQIEDALYTAYGSRQISTIYAPNNQYQVIMELAPEFQSEPRRSIGCSTCGRCAGKLVPLAVAGADHAEHRARSPSTTRASCPSVTISFNLKPGVSLGDAVDRGRQGRRARRCRPRSGRASRGPRRRSRASIAGPRDPAPRGDPRHLHGARDPLRELHPPAHDPLGAARSRASARSSR